MARPGVEDMTSLQELSEDSLLQNLKVRYAIDIIYTYVGSILVSVNPFKLLPIYSTDKVKEYRGQKLGALPPHIFATADVAYRNMRENRHGQSVVISGESGAGKSESTKLILQYLAAMTDNHSWVEQQILESNTVLEAFGNAKTVRNNNSSRFGKFIEIHFDMQGHIIGARIVQYLLEKSRIVHQEPEERNYHIFYQLIAGTNAEEKQLLQLTEAKNYKYLNQSGCVSLPGVDDKEDFQKVKLALTVLKVSDADQVAMMKTLAAILHLSNLEFIKEREGSKVKNGEVLNQASTLLNVNNTGLALGLTVRIMKVRGTSTAIPLKPEEAVDARDALTKALYSRMFNWLVENINKSIALTTESFSFIGVLDIFGFENFKFNSFEQLCINFANEKLQQFFIQHIFKLEQEEYSKEKISWENIEFIDNQECLDLVEKRPVGILSLLDEECKFPNGSDKSLLEKLHTKLVPAFKNHYSKPRTAGSTFGVKHYAGLVNYDTTGFLDKNKDSLFDELAQLVKDSDVPFIAGLFGDWVENDQKRKTVSAQFKEQLTSLLTTLSATEPHYVRCVKPNSQKIANVFDDELILTQLRYSGMLETIRIRRAGYPLRYVAKNFYDKYRVLNPKVPTADLLQSSKLILEGLPVSKALWTIGLTKVFMKDKLLPELNELRQNKIKQCIATISRYYITWKMRQKFKQKKIVASRLQLIIRGFFQQRKFNRSRTASTALTCRIRKRNVLKEFLRQKKAILYLIDLRQRKKLSMPPPPLPVFEPPRAVEVPVPTKPISRSVTSEPPQDEAAMLAALDSLNFSDDANASGAPHPSTTGPLIDDDLSKQFASLQNFLDMDLLNDITVAEDTVAPMEPKPSTDIFDQLNALDNLLSDAPVTIEPHQQEPGTAVSSTTTASDATPPGQPAKSATEEVKQEATFNAYNKDLEEMASKFFGPQITGGILGTKKMIKGKDVIMFSKSPIASSMLKYQSDWLIKESVELFEMIMKCMLNGSTHVVVMGDLTAKDADKIVNVLLPRGLKVPQLRDEIYCQLMKQTNHHPKPKHALKGWELCCMCCSLFTPSPDLREYVVSYIQSCIALKDPDLSPKASYALKRLARTYMIGGRRYPASTIELKACTDAKPIFLRVTLPDKASKVIDADSATTPKEICTHLAEKIDLKEKAGFALYVVTGTKESSLRENEILGDILYWWEQKDPNFKLCFKKKVFLNPRDTPTDPVAEYLIYHQSRDNFVEDAYPCTDREAIKLAALYVQILWGDYDQHSKKAASMKQIEDEIPKALPKSLLVARPVSYWVVNVLEKYSTLGKMTAAEAKEKYMKQIKQFPLFGSTLFKAKPTDAWFGSEVQEVFVAVNYKQVAILDKTKTVTLAAYDLPQIYVCSYTSKTFEFTVKDESKRGTIHTFETNMGDELDPLIRSYSAFYRISDYSDMVVKDEAEQADFVQLYFDVSLPPPIDGVRYQWKNYVDANIKECHQFVYSSHALTTALHKSVESESMNRTAIEISQRILQYIGDGAGSKSKQAQMEHLKFIIGKGINVTGMRNEIYCQVIKQTINNSRMLSRRKAWQLLLMCVGCFLPTKDLINYVRLYLQQQSELKDEQGAIALYIHKRLQKTININGTRKEPPSFFEWENVKKRKAISLQVGFTDGKSVVVGIDSSSMGKEICSNACKKGDLKNPTTFSLYLAVGDDPDTEISVKDTTLLCDVISSFEAASKTWKLIIKQRIWSPTKLLPDEDPMTKRLVYTQLMEDVVNERFAVTEQEILLLAALHMQILWGNYNPSTVVISDNDLAHFIPKSIISGKKPEEWRKLLVAQYTLLKDKSATDAMELYVQNLLKIWPNFIGTTIFHAKQSLSVNLPKELWIGVNTTGIHIFQINKKDPIMSWKFQDILNWGPSPDSFFFMCGDLMQPQKFVFNTIQGGDISELMHIYVKDIVLAKKADANKKK